MGQAKRRGTREERIQQARDRHKPVSLDKVREELGLPPTAQFLGYVVHSPRADEFLVQRKESQIMDGWAWAKSPSLARVYEQFSEASFDEGEQLYVGWSE